MKKLGCLILAAAFAGGFALCSFESRKELARAAAPQPPSSLTENQRYYFYIVGFKEGAPKLVRLSDVAEDGTHPEVDTFYIPAAQLQSVRDALAKNHPGDIMAIERLEVQNDDAQAKRQRVAIDINADDYAYHPVYDVDGARVIPVSYGDLTRREGFQAARKALPSFAVVMVVGAALSLPAFFKKRKEPAGDRWSLPPQPAPDRFVLFAVRFKPYAAWIGVIGLLFAGAALVLATSRNVAPLTILAISVSMLAWSMSWIASWFGPARTANPAYDMFRWVFIAMWWCFWALMLAVGALTLT